MAGEDDRDNRAMEDLLEEEMPVSQWLRRMR